jgi:hypothetical protein
VVSNERLELTGPRGQPPRDVAPDEGRFHEEGRNHDVPYGSPSGSVPPRFLESEEGSQKHDVPYGSPSGSVLPCFREEVSQKHDVPYGSPSGSVLSTRCPSGGPSGQTFRGVPPEKK